MVNFHKYIMKLFIAHNVKNIQKQKQNVIEYNNKKKVSLNKKISGLFKYFLEKYLYYHIITVIYMKGFKKYGRFRYRKNNNRQFS